MTATALWMAVLGYYAMAIVSAVFPWVNAEVLMLSAIPAARSPPVLAAFVAAVSAGQMTGKGVLYWLGRRSMAGRVARLGPPAIRGGGWQRALDRWRARFEANPRSALTMTFASALIGFPPLFAIAIAAGALRVAFGAFLAACIAGRLIHFALVALAPELIRRTL